MSGLADSRRSCDCFFRSSTGWGAVVAGCCSCSAAHHLIARLAGLSSAISLKLCPCRTCAAQTCKQHADQSEHTYRKFKVHDMHKTQPLKRKLTGGLTGKGGHWPAERSLDRPYCGRALTAGAAIRVLQVTKLCVATAACARSVVLCAVVDNKALRMCTGNGTLRFVCTTGSPLTGAAAGRVCRQEPH